MLPCGGGRARPPETPRSPRIHRAAPPQVHIPRAGEALSEEGIPRGGRGAEDRWRAYAGRMLGQLEWWGGAARQQRAAVDPATLSPPLREAPAQRDAPPPPGA